MRAFFILFACSMNAAIAATDSITLKNGITLFAARKIILAEGWKPHHIYSGEHIGVEHELLARGIEEIEVCSQGKSFCTFNYKKNNQCLRLITEGEQIQDMRVASWDSECEKGIAITVHDDVNVFIENADECEHQAGEWDSDLEKAEKKRIEAAIVKYCGTAKKQLHTLTKKYKNDTGVQKILVDHSYDSVKDFEK